MKLAPSRLTAVEQDRQLAEAFASASPAEQDLFLADFSKKHIETPAGLEVLDPYSEDGRI